MLQLLLYIFCVLGGGGVLAGFCFDPPTHFYSTPPSLFLPTMPRQNLRPTSRFGCAVIGSTSYSSAATKTNSTSYSSAAHDANDSRTYRLGAAAVDKLVYNLAAVVSGVGAVGFAKKRNLKGGNYTVFLNRSTKRFCPAAT